MKKNLFLLLFVLLAMGAQAAVEVLVKSKPISATVYTSGGAAVTRDGTAEVHKGRTVLKINDLPKAIDFSTLRVKVGGSAIVMSIKTGFETDTNLWAAEKISLGNKIRQYDSLTIVANV